jgi:hypothetical protein
LTFSTAASDVNFGIKGGIGHFSYYGSDYGDILDDPDLSNGLKLGLVAGVFASLPISDSISLQPELLIAMQGDKFRGDAAAAGPYDGVVKMIDKVPYLSIPFLIKFHMSNISIFAGPDVLIKIGTGEMEIKATDDALDALVGGSADYPSEDYVDFGYAAVAGVAFPLSNKAAQIMLDARFQLGLNNVLNDEVYITELKQYAIIVMVEYAFGR